MDPLTIFMLGAGALAFREMNKKDFGVLSPEREERYRQAMEHCYDTSVLRDEAKLFDSYGLKAEAAMLRQRAKWRGRSEAERQAHEEIYQKAMQSTNVPAIMAVADGFEEWTATDKARLLREHAAAVEAASTEPAPPPAPPEDEDTEPPDAAAATPKTMSREARLRSERMNGKSERKAPEPFTGMSEVKDAS